MHASRRSPPSPTVLARIGIATLILGGAASAPASAASVAESLFTGLQACQAALRGALRQEDLAQADALLALCDPHREALLTASAAPGLSLSSTQKKDVLALTDRQLRLVRELSQRTREGPGARIAIVPFLARVTATENGLRVFYDRLAALESWSLGSALRLGAVRFLDGSIEPVGGASALLLLDHGSRVDAGFELATSTPLREEAGIVRLPPREIDAVAITQAWVEFKRYRNFQLKLGVFPDQEGFITPRRWPFVSLHGRATLLRVEGFEAHLAVRHDVFGLFSPRQGSSRARVYERDLSELVGSYETAASEVEWQARAGWRLHWYTDGEDGLPSLSLGRRRYLSSSPAPEGTRYRVGDRFASLRASFPQRGTALGLKAEGWNNVLAGGGGRGNLAAVEGSFKLGAVEAVLEASRVEAGCASLPPVAMRPIYLPGTLNRTLEVEVSYAASESLQLFAKAVRNVPTPLGTRGVCENVTQAGLGDDAAVVEAIAGLAYRIPGDATGME